MGDYADALVAFRLNNSVGTTHIIEYAKSKNLKIRTYEISLKKLNLFIKINKNLNINEHSSTIINNLYKLLINYDNINITTDNKKLKELIEVNIFNNNLNVNIIKNVDITSYDEIIFITVNNSISEYNNYMILNNLIKSYKVIDIKVNDIKLFDYNIFIKYINKYVSKCSLNNEAVTTNSIYLKFNDSRLGSIRVSDHTGRLKYAYKWNIGSDIYKKRIDKNDGYVRYYYPITDEISIFKDMLAYKDSLNG